MKIKIFQFIAFFSLVFALNTCGGGGGPTPTDTGVPDIDISVDIPGDMPLDVPPDAPQDVPPDVKPDVISEVEDVIPDVTPDADAVIETKIQGFKAYQFGSGMQYMKASGIGMNLYFGMVNQPMSKEIMLKNSKYKLKVGFMPILSETKKK
jgi:hypothetical protein